MTSAISNCRRCGKPGRWGFDDDWCHEEHQAAIDCPLEGWDGRSWDGPSLPELDAYGGYRIERLNLLDDYDALNRDCPTCSAPAGHDCHGFGICDARMVDS